MALLDAARRTSVWAEFMREASSARDPVAVDKLELKAAADAIDAWIEANTASLNTAIPQPARAALTARQKKQLFLRVAAHRFEVEA